MGTWSHRSVLALGQSWLDRLLPKAISGRFFLVGGSFKTLLHGQPPRDLDLFGADDLSRKNLIDALRCQGALILADNPPYQQTLSLGELTVEVSYDTTQASLEDRLAASDLALSAAGCERGPAGDRALVHPLASESVRRRQVLLLKPLVNWKYALYTIERMYRYAEELGFAVPAEEEAYAWAIFTAQTPSERRAMLRRYQRVSHGVDTILARAEALCEGCP